MMKQEIKACAVGAVVGVLLAAAYVVNYVEAYRDDMLQFWIGDRSVVANVALGKACPQAMVCLVTPGALVLRSKIFSSDDRPIIFLSTRTGKRYKVP